MVSNTLVEWEQLYRFHWGDFIVITTEKKTILHTLIGTEREKRIITDVNTNNKSEAPVSSYFASVKLSLITL